MATVFILVKAQPKKIEHIIMDLLTIEGIVRALPVTGVYDIITDLNADTIGDALKKVYQNVSKIPGIEHTETLVVTPV